MAGDSAGSCRYQQKNERLEPLEPVLDPVKIQPGSREWVGKARLYLYLSALVLGLY